MSGEYADERASVATVSPKRPTRARKSTGSRARKASPPASGTPVLDMGLRLHKRMAYRFAAMFRGTFAHTPGRGWLEFNGSNWEECGESRPWNGVHSVCMAALAELPAVNDRDERDALYEDVRLCDTAGGTAGVLKHAQHWPGIGLRDEDFDRHSHLFVCRNGTYDLTADAFRPSDPADLMTLASNVDYDPTAECPLYDELLGLFQKDEQVRAYLHRLGGAAMEGRQNLQQVIVNYGQTGGNGKGTIQRAWMHVFGSYSHILPVEAMLARKGYDQYKDEKAQLKGKRLVYLTEPAAGQKFDTGTVKSLTGGEAVTSRAVYKASVTFVPTWLIMVSTNNRISTPKDGGMERRLKEIGWTHTIDKKHYDTTIDEKLMAEGSGILNRLLAGWREFKAGGAQEPEQVERETAEYLASVDPYAAFLADCVEQHQGVETPSGSVYQTYVKWCDYNGERAVAIRLFSPELERRGFEKKAKKTGNVWVGLALLDTPW